MLLMATPLTKKESDELIKENKKLKKENKELTKDNKRMENLIITYRKGFERDSFLMEEDKKEITRLRHNLAAIKRSRKEKQENNNSTKKPKLSPPSN
jgi:hypothetical protein